MHCTCTAMVLAMASGLIRFSPEAGAYYVRPMTPLDRTPPLRWCPWCGLPAPEQSSAVPWSDDVEGAAA